MTSYEKVAAVVGWVRDKKITGYRISKETNAREMSVIALAQGRAKIDNISFATALGLIDFYDKIIKSTKDSHIICTEGNCQKLPFLISFKNMVFL